MRCLLDEDDIMVVNLNDWSSGHNLGASPKKPMAVVIWADVTVEMAEHIKQKLLRVDFS